MKKYIAVCFVALALGFYLGNHVVAKQAGKAEVIQLLDALKNSLKEEEKPVQKSEFNTKEVDVENMMDTSDVVEHEVYVPSVGPDADTLEDVGVSKE